MTMLKLAAMQAASPDFNQFAFVVSDVDSGAKAVFDFGDGTAYEAANVTTGTATISHTYAKNGTYLVNVFAGTGTQQLQLTVTGAALPAIALAADPGGSKRSVAAVSRALGSHALLDWDDSTPDQTVQLFGGAAWADHRYAAADTYDVTAGAIGSLASATDAVVVPA